MRKHRTAMASGKMSSNSSSASSSSDYVTLVSSDGFEFHVLRSCAVISGAIKRMLDPSST